MEKIPVIRSLFLFGLLACPLAAQDSIRSYRVMRPAETDSTVSYFTRIVTPPPVHDTVTIRDTLRLYWNGSAWSTTATIPPSSVAPCKGVQVAPGASIQAASSAAGTGDTLCLLPGIHRMQSVTPKQGQVFLGSGQGQTILSGAKVLTGWTLASGRWSVGSQTQSAFHKDSWQCLPSHPLCYESEMLWVDTLLYIRVATTGELGPGKWHFDEAADKISLTDNPTGKTVETSVTERAFAGSVTGVSIKHLTVRRYATSNGYGAIGWQSSGSGWTVEDVRAEENHGAGIKGSTGWKILGSTMLRNGQMGYACSGDGILFDGDTIAYNNTNGNTAGTAGEAGAGKCTRSDGLTFRNSFVHHNKGPGPWTDIDNIRTLYEYNTVEDNDWRGIFHEISYDAVIRYNMVRRNGFKTPFASPAVLDRAGILVSSSKNVEVYGNIVEDNFHGITALETDRPAGPLGEHHTENLYVHDNTVRQTDTGKAGGLSDADPSADPYSVAANNRWVANHTICSGATRWYWGNAVKTKPQWVALPMDAAGTFTGC